MHVSTPVLLKEIFEQRGMTNIEVRWMNGDPGCLQILIPDINQIACPDFLNGVLETLKVLGYRHVVTPR